MLYITLQFSFYFYNILNILKDHPERPSIDKHIWFWTACWHPWKLTQLNLMLLTYSLPFLFHSLHFQSPWPPLCRISTHLNPRETQLSPDQQTCLDSFPSHSDAKTLYQRDLVKSTTYLAQPTVVIIAERKKTRNVLAGWCWCWCCVKQTDLLWGPLRAWRSSFYRKPLLQWYGGHAWAVNTDKRDGALWGSNSAEWKSITTQPNRGGSHDGCLRPSSDSRESFCSVAGTKAHGVSWVREMNREWERKKERKKEWVQGKEKGERSENRKIRENRQLETDYKREKRGGKKTVKQSEVASKCERGRDGKGRRVERQRNNINAPSERDGSLALESRAA